MNELDLADIRNLIVAAIETLGPEVETSERVERAVSVLRSADREVGQMMALELISSKSN